ncbi:hypothetical protein QBC37DRAFT_389845 [Rhypophila decipiens]|uniref:Uncharacterized protein n=1 Tax=Rhypophila decipiens TaxID=261697 RepID=A0AAN7B527_9PEZI|nr:hypothetical protein QBC37DRAFT_389845 [Rhypophila decipiens]
MAFLQQVWTRISILGRALMARLNLIVGPWILALPAGLREFCGWFYGCCLTYRYAGSLVATIALFDSVPLLFCLGYVIGTLIFHLGAALISFAFWITCGLNFFALVVIIATMLAFCVWFWGVVVFLIVRIIRRLLNEPNPVPHLALPVPPGPPGPHPDNNVAPDNNIGPGSPGPHPDNNVAPGGPEQDPPAVEEQERRPQAVEEQERRPQAVEDPQRGKQPTTTEARRIGDKEWKTKQASASSADRNKRQEKLVCPPSSPLSNTVQLPSFRKLLTTLNTKIEDKKSAKAASVEPATSKLNGDPPQEEQEQQSEQQSEQRPEQRPEPKTGPVSASKDHQTPRCDRSLSPIAKTPGAPKIPYASPLLQRPPSPIPPPPFAPGAPIISRLSTPDLSENKALTKGWDKTPVPKNRDVGLISSTNQAPDSEKPSEATNHLAYETHPGLNSARTTEPNPKPTPLASNLIAKQKGVLVEGQQPTPDKAAPRPCRCQHPPKV